MNVPRSCFIPTNSLSVWEQNVLITRMDKHSPGAHPNVFFATAHNVLVRMFIYYRYKLTGAKLIQTKDIEVHIYIVFSFRLRKHHLLWCQNDLTITTNKFSFLSTRNLFHVHRGNKSFKISKRLWMTIISNGIRIFICIKHIYQSILFKIFLNVNEIESCFKTA